ncbi:hypothetical protein GCM10022215_28540 [Nocardioides fonticola]|uniref:Glycosyltransferase RgtA/B/C/D-like domain-containing protein n=1 Tax=Nocardioides fonticola TaxID=450363 RepID=A0ABP7XN57_9ACTN
MTEVMPQPIRRRDREAQAVQAVGRRPSDIERRPWESAAVFALFALAYTAIGGWLVVQRHVVGFEALDRLNRTLMVWHNDPPKLAAVGFDHAPLSTLLLAPLTVVPALARSLWVVPLASALFAAGTMTSLNTLLRRALLPAPLRAGVLLALGANPLVVWYAASGAREFVWLSFAVAGIGALVAWYVTADVRFVMIAGLCFAVGTLTGYGTLAFFGIGVALVAGVLGRLGAGSDEVEGTTVGFATPAVYVVALWTAFNLLLLGDPIAWVTGQHQSTGLPAGEILGATLRLVVDGAPLALVVLPALVVVGVARRNALALGLAGMLAVAIAAPAVAAWLHLTDEPLHLRNAVAVLLLAVVGGVWLARALEEQGRLVAGGLVAALLVSIPWTFHTMRTYPYQDLESVAVAAVTDGDQEGATAMSGAAVGIADEQEMAAWIRAHVTRRGSILTDNAQTFGVMLLTGRPDLFDDRVDAGDAAWSAAAHDPAGHVDLLLLSRDTSRDLLSRLYPAAAAGTDPALVPVMTTDRYVLVGVPATYVRPDDAPVLDTTAADAASTASTAGATS